MQAPLSPANVRHTPPANADRHQGKLPGCTQSPVSRQAPVCGGGNGPSKGTRDKPPIRTYTPLTLARKGSLAQGTGPRKAPAIVPPVCRGSVGSTVDRPRAHFHV